VRHLAQALDGRPHRLGPGRDDNVVRFQDFPAPRRTEVRHGGRTPCVHVTSLIHRRLAEVEATRNQLTALAARAAAQDPADCHGYCSIIAD
jgi:hypothetical protein